MKATLSLHLRYFFLTEEKELGLIAAVCFVMGLTLAVFFAYHCNLAWKNMTTNESYKRPAEIRQKMTEVRIFDSLIKECDDWKEHDEDMPRTRVDDVMLPAKSNERRKWLE